jgi:PTH1 family peptidyl-tRNA hydrolase
MYLIAGLGNIGDRFTLTRHNIGFEAVDYIASQYGIVFSQKDRFNGMIGQGMIENEKVLLVKPSTYMNLSGECIRPVMDWYQIDSPHLIVIHDDVDFAPGVIKVRKQGEPARTTDSRILLQNSAPEISAECASESATTNRWISPITYFRVFSRKNFRL